MAASTISFPLAEKKVNSVTPRQTLDGCVAKPAQQAGKGARKRTLTMLKGETVNLNATFNATPEIIEAMKQRIFQLEDELEASQKEPPAKRARVSTAAATPTAPSASSSKADEKKRKVQLKEIYDQLKRECKSDTCKFQGSSKSIKIEEVLQPEEFQGLFSGKGVLIQPSPTNKPNSVVTIMKFTTQAHLEELFGNELKPLKGNVWTRGVQEAWVV